MSLHKRGGGGGDSENWRWRHSGVHFAAQRSVGEGCGEARLVSQPRAAPEKNVRGSFENTENNGGQTWEEIETVAEHSTNKAHDK